MSECRICVSCAQSCQKISTPRETNLYRFIFLYLKEIFKPPGGVLRTTNMSDQTYLLILRLLHIGCGITWAGTVIFVAFFLDPAVKSVGPDGTRFMQQLVKTN